MYSSSSVMIGAMFSVFGMSGCSNSWSVKNFPYCPSFTVTAFSKLKSNFKRPHLADVGCVLVTAEEPVTRKDETKFLPNFPFKSFDRCFARLNTATEKSEAIWFVFCVHSSSLKKVLPIFLPASVRNEECTVPFVKYPIEHYAFIPRVLPVSKRGPHLRYAVCGLRSAYDTPRPLIGGWGIHRFGAFGNKCTAALPTAFPTSKQKESPGCANGQYPKRGGLGIS